jgi:hypothetical protein
MTENEVTQKKTPNLSSQCLRFYTSSKEKGTTNMTYILAKLFLFLLALPAFNCAGLRAQKIVDNIPGNCVHCLTSNKYCYFSDVVKNHLRAYCDDDTDFAAFKTGDLNYDLFVRDNQGNFYYGSMTATATGLTTVIDTKGTAAVLDLFKVNKGESCSIVSWSSGHCDF